MTQPNEDWSRQEPGLARWSRTRADLGIALWSSFLAAAAASVVCFAFVDPAVIGFPTQGSTAARMTGYTLGFFLFWAATLSASALTLYLVRTARNGSASSKTPMDDAP